MNVAFQNVESPKIHNCFLQVMESYTSLHDCKVTLSQRPIRSSTMQAQPVIRMSTLFGKTQEYRLKLAVYVRDSDQIKVEELPEDVLAGWFAHELGHIVDYRSYGDLQMIVYGLKYLFSGKFKRAVEHTADYIAIKNGFREEIIATKRFILEHALLDEKYKARIKRYYMPIEEAAIWQHSRVRGIPDGKL